MKQFRHFLVLVAALVLVVTSCQKAPKEIPVSSVSLNKTSQELVVGESVQLNATVNPSDATEKTITWSSSHQAVATVAGGKVTAISEGTTSITASAGGKSATCSITVKKKTVGVMSIELNKTELTLTEGESETLVATVKPEDATDKTVTWSTSNAEVATVDNGKVVAVKEGESVISAKAGDKTATCKVVVDKKVITVSSVELNKNTLELVEGDSETLVATVKPDDATDKAVTWVTSDESIAAVEDDGKVTANKEGEATITAKAGDKSATCKVIVAKRIIPVTEVTLDHETLDLVEGDEVTLTATVKPDDATDKTVTWSTSDASIATIDEEGKITALAEGTATISASAGEMSMTCLVTVYKKVGQFLTFRSDGTTTVSMYNLSSNAPVLYYSYDRIHWTKWDYSELSFTNSAPLYLYGDNPEGISSREDKYSSFKAHGDSFGVSGSIMSLIDKNTDLKSIPSDFCFFSLFEECTLLTTAPELPATSLTKCCYKNMFYKCYSLASAPELPATTLAKACYHGMFYECESLKKAPNLHATTLAEKCYVVMFRGCTSLERAPELPAATLSDQCYSQMFFGCTSLVETPELPATTLANSCYSSMFADCKSLTTAPDLPATTLADHCYSSMFSRCTSLVETPELPATTLAISCYNYMFEDCSSLTTAPEILPATSLAEGCYYYMFNRCSSLKTAPKLPATTLASTCYYAMFSRCTSLTAAPVLPATTLDVCCYTSMFERCTSLTMAPELPATTLTYGCYSWMFKECTGLTSAPSLPAITLADSCYSGMFEGCGLLTTAPKLPATTLANDCYDSMFRACSSLISAPELPATELKEKCYLEMFSYCSSLTTAPEILPATTLSSQCYERMFLACESLTTAPVLPATSLSSYCYRNMFYGCKSLNYIKAMFTKEPSSYWKQTTNWVSGVAETGTFVKNSAATWDITGSDGVPSGWTVETASN